MTYQSIFKRYEQKYMLTQEQKEHVIAAISPYMELDQYKRTTIRNVYYDTNDYRLIRHSIDKPKYKEKLRIRSYCRAQADTTVFVELKKKYNGVVYKRRTTVLEEEAVQWISGMKHCHLNTQIVNEIDYFISYYKTLHPVVFLSYEREAYFSKDRSDFRVTFDDHILCRQDNISLKADTDGTSLLSKDKVLMELKSSGGIPFWMTRILSAECIYQTSFSKYGTAYQTVILPERKELYSYA